MSQKKRTKFIKLEDISPPIPKKEDSWEELRDAALKERFSIRARTPNQQKLMTSILTNVITFVSAPAGTGKTFISCGLAAKLLLENKIERIILTRPQVEVGNNGKGFLPGDEIEKMLPYIVPMLDALEVFLGKKLLDKFIKDKIILISPLGLIRGSSYKNAMIICDEFQDITYLEAKTLLTRIDVGSRMVLAYDKDQCDLGPKHIDYQKVVDNLGDLNDEIGFIKMDISDCQRAGIVKKIIERL